MLAWASARLSPYNRPMAANDRPKEHLALYNKGRVGGNAIHQAGLGEVADFVRFGCINKKFHGFGSTPDALIACPALL